MQDALGRAWARVLLAAATLVTLMSVGGLALVLGPVLVPAHWWAAKRSRTAERVLWLLFAAATVAEAVWVATYLTAGESEPQIWLLPLTAFFVTIAMSALGLTWQKKSS